MKNQKNEWITECDNFYTWFKNLGGNIANNEQMSEAFSRIEAKKVSDNNILKLLDAEYIKNIEVNSPEFLVNGKL